MKKLIAVLLLSGSVMISAAKQFTEMDALGVALFLLEVTENVIEDTKDPKELAKKIKAQVTNVELSQAAARLRECIDFNKENSSRVTCGDLYDLYNQAKSAHVKNALLVEEQAVQQPEVDAHQNDETDIKDAIVEEVEVPVVTIKELINESELINETKEESVN